MRGDEQICWSCNKCSGVGCCWFQNNEPVPNWEAIETKIKATAETGKKYYVSSYKIQKCPLYKCDNPADELPTNIIASVTGLRQDIVREWRKNGNLEKYFKTHKRNLKKLEYYYVNKI